MDPEKPSRPGSSEAASSDTNEKSHGQTHRASGFQAPTKDVHTVQKLDSKVVAVKPDPEVALEHLPPHEREIIKRQLDVPDVKVGYLTLFRYATGKDLFVLAAASLCAVAGGVVMPLMTVWFSRADSVLGKQVRLTERRWSLVS